MSTLKVHTTGICKSHKSIVHMSVYDVRNFKDFSQFSATSAVVQYDSLSRSSFAVTLRIFK